MLKELRENPARFALDHLMDATEIVEAVAYPSHSTDTSTADILSEIRKAESAIAAANRLLTLAKSRVTKKPAGKRVIYRDVVQRYCRIYGGETRFIVTDSPDNPKVILFDADGDARGEVSLFDKFAEIPDFDYSDLPY